MFDRPATFDLTEGHVALLRDMRVEWDDMYAGAPMISCRQPYLCGPASEVVAHLAGIEAGTMANSPVLRQVYRVHRETEIALQIVLSTGSFAPGRYRRKDVEGFVWEAAR